MPKRLPFAAIMLVTLSALAAGCIGAGMPSPTPSGTGTLHVLVLGADNVPLAGAKVISNTQPEGQLKVTGSTQSDGTVTYRDIKAGAYDFYVSRFDYEQKEFTVTVMGGQVTNFTVTLVKTSAPTPSTTQ